MVGVDFYFSFYKLKPEKKCQCLSDAGYESMTL